MSQNEKKKKRQERFTSGEAAAGTSAAPDSTKRAKIEAVVDPEQARKMEERAKRFAAKDV